MDKKYKITSICALVFSFFFLTFGFASFTSELTISDVGATIRQPLDVRITNLSLTNAEGGAISNNQDFNAKEIISDITLPQNGSITYEVEFTNYTTYPVYLLEITDLPSDLKYEIDIEKEDKYSIGELFIENQHEIRKMTITISYKENGYNNTELYNLNIGFYFESSYTILFHNNIIPPEYQQVEYIESTGTQYIDTKVASGNNNLKFEIQYAMIKFADPEKYIGIFGAYSTEEHNTTRLIYSSNSNGNIVNAYAYLNSVAGNSVLIDNTNRRLNTIYTETLERKNNTTIYTSNAFEGTKEQNNVPNGTAYSGNIAVFSQNTSGSIASSIKLYYFKIYDTGELIKSFIPCYRKSDGEIGLYDTVTQEFYTNSGTGTFVKGNDVSDAQSQNILTSKTISLNKNSFTFLQHVFTGWNTESDGSGIAYKDEQKIYNIAYNNEVVNLYAQWRPYQSEVIFYPNGGLGNMNKLITPYGGKQTLSANTFQRAGYIFNGWNTEADGSGINYSNEETININASGGDVTMRLYAQWRKNLLPREYKEVDYIESTGTQYIDTKVLFNNSNLQFEIQYAMTKLPASTSYYAGIFGAYSSEANNTIRLIYNGANVLAYHSTKAGNGALKDTTVRTINTIYTETLERKNNITMYTSNAFEGVKEKSDAPNGNAYSSNIAIFSQNTSGSIASSMKLYYFKIYDNDTPVRNFVPCYRISDKVIGLYDTVTKEFYVNKGSGTFIKGKDV